jgi:hypothetical protein
VMQAHARSRSARRVVRVGKFRDIVRDGQGSVYPLLRDMANDIDGLL